jgi:dihydrofolate reductase
MAGKVFFSVTLSLDGFMAPEPVPFEDVFSPEKQDDPGVRRIAGGAETIQEYLDTGLVDEFSLTLAPVLFGTGIRLFDRVDPDRLALNQVRTAASTQVTHLTYAVGKR